MLRIRAALETVLKSLLGAARILRAQGGLQEIQLSCPGGRPSTLMEFLLPLPPLPSYGETWCPAPPGFNFYMTLRQQTL